MFLAIASRFKSTKPAVKFSVAGVTLNLNRPNTSVSSTPKKAFAARLNTLRFIAICSIVWGHSLIGLNEQSSPAGLPLILQTSMIECGRIGTVIFFIISGYFLAGKIKKHSILTYLSYRMRSIIIPWLIFLFICVTLQVFQLFSIWQLLHLPLQTTLPVVTTLLSASVFYAAYWFIPVSIFSACLLIAAKKYYNSVWFGALLFCITAFYCVNLYQGWIDTNHTKSFLGYTFFMWLGVWFKNNATLVEKAIIKFPWRYLLIAFFVFFLLSCKEGLFLRTIGCKDPFASIRVSNIILSVLILIIFLKNRSLYTIKKLSPEKYVYGVYLVHSIILLLAMPLIVALLKYFEIGETSSFLLLAQLLFFVVIMTFSYLISVAIKNSRLHFLMGR